MKFKIGDIIKVKNVSGFDIYLSQKGFNIAEAHRIVQAIEYTSDNIRYTIRNGDRTCWFFKDEIELVCRFTRVSHKVKLP